jgi:hypothetical protein
VRVPRAVLAADGRLIALLASPVLVLVAMTGSSPVQRGGAVLIGLLLGSTPVALTRVVARRVGRSERPWAFAALVAVACAGILVCWAVVLGPSAAGYPGVPPDELLLTIYAAYAGVLVGTLAGLGAPGSPGAGRPG